MPPLYVVEQGAKLHIEKRRIRVMKEDELIIRVPLAHLSAVILFGNVGITTPAMKRLMQTGVDTIFLTQQGRYQGRLLGPLSKHGLLRRSQYERVNDEQFNLALAQHIIAAKCRNMQALLRRYQRRQALDLTEQISRLRQLRVRVFRTTRLSSLRGVEGRASAIYFQAFHQLLQEDWVFHKRVRRPPTDPINVLLSFGYTLLTRDMEAMVSLVGFDPHIGILHRIEYGRPSLALDLVEEFRAVVVDSVVLQVVNNMTLKPNDFQAQDDANRPILLTDGGKRRFIKAYETRMALELTHPTTREKMTYRRAMEIQARLLARCLRDGTHDYQPFEVKR